MAPKQTDPQFKLRLTPELKAKIESGAAENGRSMNSEILDLLTFALEDDIGDRAELLIQMRNLQRENREKEISLKQAIVYERQLKQAAEVTLDALCIAVTKHIDGMPLEVLAVAREILSRKGSKSLDEAQHHLAEIERSVAELNKRFK